MYSATREFEAPEVDPQRLLDVVYDVEDYPQFVRGVRAVAIQNRGPASLLADFTAGVGGMEFVYTLFVERDPEEVRWRRVAGSFRASEGAMTHLGEARFRYRNAMDPGFAVPGFAVRFVLESSLPRLIREFRQRALERGRVP
ncbi:MAG: type II toxin-antitoxin system RatA family toxin [Planctomycetota bacterium]